jgi:hypothetical protein
MPAIPKGYELKIVHDGVIIATLDLQGYDLDKPAARADVVQEIQNEIELDQKRWAK